MLIEIRRTCVRPIYAMLVGCTVFAGSAAAQTPTLLSDIDASVSGEVQDSDPEWVVAHSGALWLAANGDPWRYDPQSGTAIQLAGNYPLQGEVVDAGAGRVVMRLETVPAFAQVGGLAEIFSSDGTATGGATLLEPPKDAISSDIFEWNGAPYFLARIQGAQAELWTTDGTASGTQMVQVLPIVPEPLADLDLAFAAGTLFVSNRASGALIALDAPNAVATVLDVGAGIQADLSRALESGGDLYFTATTPALGSELWKSDGTLAGTLLVADVEDGASSSSPHLLAADSNRVWFSAEQLGLGRELWITEGSAASTFNVADVNPGEVGGVPIEEYAPDETADALILPGGDLLFAACDETTGPLQGEVTELFRSDGTTAGTGPIVETTPFASAGLWPRNFVLLNGVGYYTADQSGFGNREVWYSDGTLAGSGLVADLLPSVGGSIPQIYTALGSLWLSADNGVNGRELLRSDGTEAGTELAFEFAPETTGSGIDFGEPALRFGDELFFSGSTPETGEELWATDGTPEGTRFVADLKPGEESSNPVLQLVLGSRILLTTGSPDEIIWTTDGSAPGTSVLVDPLLAPNPDEFVRLRDLALFSTSAAQSLVWRTDGTPEGTSSIAATTTRDLTDSAVLDGFLYFFGRNANGDRAVWRSDGTAEETGNYADVPNNPLESDLPRSFVRSGDLIYFIGPGSTTATEALWSIDGSPGGAERVLDLPTQIDYGMDLVPIGDRLLFVSDGGSIGTEPWVTDGTPEGTQLLVDIVPGSGSSDPNDFLTLGSNVYFTARSSTGSNVFREIWKTDGTPEGTAIVATDEVLEYSIVYPRRELGSLEELLYVAGSEGTERELWRHDPFTGVQTSLSEPIRPGVEGSRPGRVYELNGYLVFDAESAFFGRELFSIKLADIGVPSAEPYGNGCAFASAEPSASLLGSLTPGGDFELRLEGASPNALALAYHAFAAPTFELGGGCNLYLDLFSATLLVTTTTDVSGQALSSLSLPANPALVGLQQSLQYISVEAGGPLLGGFALSNAVDVVIG